MKPTIFKLSSVFLLFALIGASCQEDNLKNLTYDEAYISGWFIGQEVDSDGKATGKETNIGYCILLKDSEKANSNQPMDFYTFSFPDSLFSFPDTSMYPFYDSNNCGPIFFPDSIKDTYKFKFDFETVSELEKVNFIMGCYHHLPTFEWEKYKQLKLNTISN